MEMKRKKDLYPLEDFLEHAAAFGPLLGFDRFHFGGTESVFGKSLGGNSLKIWDYFNQVYLDSAQKVEYGCQFIFIAQYFRKNLRHFYGTLAEPKKGPENQPFISKKLLAAVHYWFTKNDPFEYGPQNPDPQEIISIASEKFSKFP